jgi:hypothetical protein
MTDMSKFTVAKAFRHLDPNQGLADGISSGFSSLRYRGKQWTLQHGGKSYSFRRDDDGTPLSYVDVVILGISPGLSKAYFGQETWTEDSATGPICYSLKGDVPDPGVPIQQAKSCGICSHNEWITKPGGGRGKECQDHKRMAVLLMPYMTKKMLSVPLLEPVHLKIPPGSLKSLKLYSDELQQLGIPFASMITRVAFSTDKLFQMTFKAVQALTDAEAPLVLPLMEDAQTRQILGSIPEIREIAPPMPAEKVETGLLAAFKGQSEPESEEEKPAPAPAPAPRQRGRPAGSQNKPKVVEMAAQAPEPEASSTPAEGAGDVTWEESDTEIDAALAKLVGDKMKNMLK